MHHADLVDAFHGRDIHTYHFVVLGNELKQRPAYLTESDDYDLILCIHGLRPPQSKSSCWVEKLRCGLAVHSGGVTYLAASQRASVRPRLRRTQQSLLQLSAAGPTSVVGTSARKRYYPQLSRKLESHLSGD